MKNHKRESRSIDLEGPIEVVFERIREQAAGLIDPELEIEWGWDENETRLVGWVPMTPREISMTEQAAKKTKEREEQRKKEKAESERKEYERLKKKFEGG